MRLTWLSNAPWTPTGYGQQTALFTTRLVKAGHPVAVISNYGHQGAVMNWNGVQVFGNSFHPYGMDVMAGHTKTFEAAALVTLMDLQVFEPEALAETKWIAWFPIDHHNIPPIILHNARIANQRIVMSKHAAAELDKYDLDYEYIPHGINTDEYKPLDMLKCREDMGLPLDKFIIGMVAMNKGTPSRKAFKQNISAFAALKAKHKDVCMYVHTMDGTRGADMEHLPSFVDALGLSYGYHMSGDNSNKDVIFAHQYGMAMGYEKFMMAKLYSAMDVLTAVTMGEGFGIPIIEAQACGTPVIVGDWTSMPELCESGWKVSRDEAEPMFTPLGAWQYLPRAVAIAERMEQAYQMKGNRDYRKRAVKGVQKYNADRITTEKWLPFFDKIGDKLQQPSSVLDRQLGVLR